MSSKQKQIRDKASQLLSAIPGVKIFRSLRRETAQSDLPAILLYSHHDRPRDENEDQCGGHQRVYTLRVEIRIAARVEDDATDDLAVSVRRALIGQEIALGVQDIVWSEQGWDGDEGQWPLAGTFLDFAITYEWSPE